VVQREDPVDVTERHRVAPDVERSVQIGAGDVGEASQAAAVDGGDGGLRAALDDEEGAGDADDGRLVTERRRGDATRRRPQAEPAGALLAGSGQDVGGDELEGQAGVGVGVDLSTLRPRTSSARAPRSPIRRMAMANDATHAAATIAMIA
jgi:hypothetical protein